MENISIYSEARNEYMKQLSTWIVPPLVEFFRNEYERIRQADSRGAMRVFQEFCATVPRWNQDVIEKNITTVLDNCRCDYIEELMTAVFIAHTKMLTAVRVSTKQKKLSITLPKLDHFLHRVFVECARSFWKAPFLFAENGTPIEKQKNILQAESMCIEALSGAVRSLLPVKNILRDYLDESESDEEASSSSKSDSKKKKPVAAADSDSSSDSDSDSAEAAAAAPAPAPAPAPVAAPFAAKEEDGTLDGELLEDLEAAAAPAPVAATTAVAEPAPESPAPLVIEKLDTPPEPPKATESNHEVKEADLKSSSVQVQKMEAAPAPPSLMIDTEPAVHFTPYDTVFDENKPGVSEIRYTEKISVEDKPPSNWGVFDDDDEEDIPKLQISDNGTAIGLDDLDDLDGGSKQSGIDLDIDAPLGSTGDFEELI